MRDTQFRVLYRQFLFRMVDIELLSADAKGDMGKLFGQFAALLIFSASDSALEQQSPAQAWSQNGVGSTS